MIDLFTVLVLLVAYGFVRLLHLASTAAPPELVYRDPCSSFVQYVLKSCPLFTEIYLPPLLWGKSGHLQTVLYAKMGRVNSKEHEGKRHYVKMPDGATMTFDVCEPLVTKKDENVVYTLVVCPGIANSCESKYIRTFLHYAQMQGYRVAVLNHIGALLSEPLTAPRMYTYGHTEDYGKMVDTLLEMYPDTKLMAVGFSMGGNIVMKYLGEDKTQQDKFICGISICQGYHINDAKVLFLEWAHMRRLYTYAMTLHQRKLLHRHRQALFENNGGKTYNMEKVFHATSLFDIDENYSSLRAGFPDAYQYYNWASSANYMNNVTIPTFLLNAKDDPICPPPLMKYPRNYAERHSNSLFVLTKHGGHLGYFEGRYLFPRTITWLDKAVIQYADCIKGLHVRGELQHMTTADDEPSVSVPTV